MADVHDQRESGLEEDIVERRVRFISALLRAAALSIGWLGATVSIVRGSLPPDWMPWAISGSFIFGALDLAERLRRKQISMIMFLLLSQALVLGVVVLVMLVSRS